MERSFGQIIGRNGLSAHVGKKRKNNKESLNIKTMGTIIENKNKKKYVEPSLWVDSYTIDC